VASFFWGLDLTGSNQLFQLIYAGEPLTYKIRAAHSGKYLDASKSKINEKGCPVEQWSGHNGNNQKWKCLDIYGDPKHNDWKKNGRHLQTKSRGYEADRIWVLIYADGPKKGKKYKFKQ
jgi:hypothetical protein